MLRTRERSRINPCDGPNCNINVRENPCNNLTWKGKCREASNNHLNIFQVSAQTLLAFHPSILKQPSVSNNGGIVNQNSRITFLQNQSIFLWGDILFHVIILSRITFPPNQSIFLCGDVLFYAIIFSARFNLILSKFLNLCKIQSPYHCTWRKDKKRILSIHVASFGQDYIPSPNPVRNEAKSRYIQRTKLVILFC